MGEAVGLNVAVSVKVGVRTRERVPEGVALRVAEDVRVPATLGLWEPLLVIVPVGVGERDVPDIEPFEGLSVAEVRVRDFETVRLRDALELCVALWLAVRVKESRRLVDVVAVRLWLWLKVAYRVGVRVGVGRVAVALAESEWDWECVGEAVGDGEVSV